MMYILQTFLSVAKFRGKQIHFSFRNTGLVVVLNFQISQGSVASQFSWGENLCDNT